MDSRERDEREKKGFGQRGEKLFDPKKTKIKKDNTLKNSTPNKAETGTKNSVKGNQQS